MPEVSDAAVFYQAVDYLFDVPPRFPGLPASGFEAFSLTDRDERRKAIILAFHPPLETLAEDLLERLGPLAGAPLCSHLPRLDWPAGYQPFCTWLALSREGHGYQSGPQLNLGVHADHVALRLGWDTAAPGFGRFEFLCRYGGLGDVLAGVAREHGFRFRVYSAAPWPEGSRRVFESEDDLAGAFREVARRGVWWEIGERHDLCDALSLVTSPGLGTRALTVFSSLLPVYSRLA